MDHCQAKTARGAPCSGFALTGSRFCFTHDPAQARARRDAHRLGGSHRRARPADAPAPSADLKTPAGLVTLMEQLIHETWSMPNSINRSRALCQLLQAQRDLLETSDLQERLLTVESVLLAREHHAGA